MTNIKALAQAIIVNLIVFMVMACIALLALELILRTTELLDQTNSPTPSYIPDRLKNEDSRIGKIGFIDVNGFRTAVEIPDLIDHLRHNKRCKIVVLGDSYVWGDGLSPDMRWPAKFQNLVNCDVYPFGKNGWSSLHYFGFYEEYLKDLDFDYLLIGLVANDPHPMGKFLGHNYEPTFMPYHLTDLYSISYMFNLQKYDYLLNKSLAFGYIDQLVKNYLATKAPIVGSPQHPPIIAYNYKSWTDRIYEDDIYNLWESALADFAKISRHRFGFLFTPIDATSDEQARWNKIERTLQKFNFVYENALEDQKAIFGDAPRPRSFWANPADGHPGDVQTTIFANKALRLLKRLGYKDNVK
ncbi:hypothetical protein V3H18_01740 [Methylocystis sp. 9N]|uniref:SGNH/GDSL hydrolase family protein n=1 Tax=Methylocystis borbori TaxID=3118750 RepID=A0ABU7XCY6_9HYPH